MVTSDDMTRTGAGSVSGANLARMALQSARAAARSRGNGSVKAKPHRRTTTVRTGGREPVGVGAVLGALVAEGAWAAPVVGGSVVDNWPSIVPTGVADHLVAVRFDADAGRLELRPDSAAYATLARLNSTDLLRRIAEHTGTDAVRHIRVLAPGHVSASRPPAAAPGPEGERIPRQPAPVRTREDASPGYHQTLAAMLATRPGQGPAAPVRAAIERQTRTVLDHRESEAEFTEALAYAAELRDHAATVDPDDSEVRHRRARDRARARAERAGTATAAPATEWSRTV